MATGWARFAHRFGQYYQHATLWSPPRIKTREWMFIPFGGAPPLRHKSFSGIGQVQSFLAQRAMHSCFYSTAYWRRPYELKMAEKQWQGADLIFDLDGTLINSMPIHNKAWMDTFAAHGAPVEEEFLHETAGMASIRIIEILNKRKV